MTGVGPPVSGFRFGEQMLYIMHLPFDGGAKKGSVELVIVVVNWPKSSRICPCFTSIFTALEGITEKKVDGKKECIPWVKVVGKSVVFTWTSTIRAEARDEM